MSLHRPVVRAVLGVLAVMLVLLSRGDLSSAAGTAQMNALLLVATDDLQDGIFGGSVVLVMNNLGPAPVGLIVNRPTQIPVGRIFPEMKALEAVPDRVYFGGPVDVDSIWFLVRSASPLEHASVTCPGVYVSASRTLLLTLLARRNPMENLRIFAGHAGWGPGQLQTEITEGAWRMEKADAARVFSRPERPWPTPNDPRSSI